MTSSSRGRQCNHNNNDNGHKSRDTVQGTSRACCETFTGVLAASARVTPLWFNAAALGAANPRRLAQVQLSILRRPFFSCTTLPRTREGPIHTQFTPRRSCPTLFVSISCELYCIKNLAPGCCFILTIQLPNDSAEPSPLATHCYTLLQTHTSTPKLERYKGLRMQGRLRLSCQKDPWMGP